MNWQVEREEKLAVRLERALPRGPSMEWSQRLAATDPTRVGGAPRGAGGCPMLAGHDPLRVLRERRYREDYAQ